MYEKAKEEKKVVSRNLAIALVIICVILANLSIDFLYNRTIVNYNSIIYNMELSRISLNFQIESLQSQIDTLEAPKLIFVNIKTDDNRPILGTPYLHVYGEVCNVGTNTAYHSKIHVVAMNQTGGVVSAYITLGTINGESWTSVDSNIYYNGSALTIKYLVLEWTTSPYDPK